jgi:hypothetical protein
MRPLSPRDRCRYATAPFGSGLIFAIAATYLDGHQDTGSHAVMPAQAGIQPWLCCCSGDSKILDSRFRGNDGIPAWFAVNYFTVITNGSTSQTYLKFWPLRAG